MKKINLIILLAVFSMTSISFGQTEKKNVVKLGLLGLGAKNFRLSYERVLTPRFTAQLSFSTLLRRDMPSAFTDGLAAEDGTGTASPAMLSYATFGGWNLCPEFRIYSKKKDGAPAGFYFGPYFKYNNYSLKMGGVDDSNINYDAIGRLTSIGGGITLGCHWIIKDVVTIDWNFLSLGVNMAGLSIDFSSNNSGIDYNAWADEYNGENVIEAPGIGKLTATATSDGIRIKTPSVATLGIRSGLAIGILF